MTDLDKGIDQLKTMANMLVPYTYPRNDPSIENDITVLKTSEITVDGYKVIAHYNRADYDDHDLCTLQIFGKDFPFLPFSLVVKIARKALGSKHLFLSEVYQDNRKVYCWTLIMNKQQQPIPYPVKKKKAQLCTFEGFEYVLMDPSHLNFY